LQLLEGPLYKEGEKVKNWKRRIFVLYPDRLIYKDKSAVLGTIKASGMKEVTKLDNIQGGPKGFTNYGFTLLVSEAGSRRYRLCAETANERDSWVSEISKVLKSGASTDKNDTSDEEEEEEEEEEEDEEEDEEEEDEEDEVKPNTPAIKEPTTIPPLNLEIKISSDEKSIRDDRTSSAKTPRSQPNDIFTSNKTPRDKQEDDIRTSTPSKGEGMEDIKSRMSRAEDEDEMTEDDDNYFDDFDGQTKDEDYKELSDQIYQEIEKDDIPEAKAVDRIEKDFLFPDEEIRKLLAEEERIRRLDQMKNQSANKRQKGELRIKMKRDNLNLGTKGFIKQLLERNTEGEVIWSATIKEINQRGKGIEKSLFLTRKALYMMEGSSTVKKRFAFTDMDSLLVNAYGDESNILSLILPTQPADFLFSCEHKKELIEHLQDAYEAEESTQLTIHTVDDVKLFTRRTKTDKKPAPMPISQDEIVRGGEKDHLSLAANSEWRMKLRKYGDRFVHFSEASPTNKKDIVIITDRAIYEAEDNSIKRRIEILDVKELVVDNLVGNTTSLLIRVPSEYDLLIDTVNRMQIVEILQTVHTLLVMPNSTLGRRYSYSASEEVEPLVLSSQENVKGMGQFKKTKEYNEKIARLRNPEAVKLQMKDAVVSKSLADIEKAMDAARKLDMEGDKFYMLCQNETKKIKQAGEVRELLQSALDEQNLPEMKNLLAKGDALKPHLSDFVRLIMPKYIKLVNTRLFVKKMQAAIDTRQTQKIKDVFAEATRAGLEDVVAQQKLEYDRVLQRENSRQLLKDYIENHDGDGIRLLLLSSKSLDIHTEKEFQEAPKYIQQFRFEAQANRSIRKAIEVANRNGIAETIRKAVDQTLKLKLEQLGEDNPLILEALAEISNVKKRSVVKGEIKAAINNKEALTLESLIEKHRADMYIDLIDARECLRLIHEEDERSRIEKVTKIRKQLDAAYHRLLEHEGEITENSAAEENEARLIELVLLAQQECLSEAADTLGQARALLDARRQERALRGQRVEQLGQQLEEAIMAKDYAKIELLVEEAETQPLLIDRVYKAREVLANAALTIDIKQDRNDLSSFLKKTLEERTDSVEALIKENTRSLEDFEISDELQELVKNNDVEGVRKFILLHEDELSDKSLQDAKRFLKEADEKNSISRRVINDIEDDKFVSFSNHTLISQLHITINKLLRSCNFENIDRSSAKHLVDVHNPHGQAVVRCIANLLSSNTRNIYFFKSRSPWDVFKSLQVSSIQNIVREFEAFDAVQNLPSENYGANATLLFVQYLLDRDYFMYAMKELLTNELYLSECYDKNSVLLARQHRDDLLSVLDLLHQFSFGFGFAKYANSSSLQLSPDMIAAHPIMQVKTAVKAIVQLFSDRVKNDGMSIQDAGTERINKEMGLLVRKKLCFAISELMMNGFKTKGFLGTYHIWHMIEKVAELKRVAVGDLGGIGIPEAVSTVNEIISLKSKNNVVTNVDDVKFRIFICYALNDQQLADTILSVLREKSLLDEYYDGNAAVRKQDIQDKTRTFLSKLNTLPFDLDLDAELL
jgi:hypothetical protein